MPLLICNACWAKEGCTSKNRESMPFFLAELFPILPSAAASVYYFVCIEWCLCLLR